MAAFDVVLEDCRCGGIKRMRHVFSSILFYFTGDETHADKNLLVFTEARCPSHHWVSFAYLLVHGPLDCFDLS